MCVVLPVLFMEVKILLCVIISFFFGNRPTMVTTKGAFEWFFSYALAFLILKKILSFLTIIQNVYLELDL